MSIGVEGAREYGTYSFNRDFRNRAIWLRKIVVFPVRNYRDNKIIWPFTYAYKGVAMWTGPGLPAYETRWMTSADYLVAKLKDEIR